MRFHKPESAECAGESETNKEQLILSPQERQALNPSGTRTSRPKWLTTPEPVGRIGRWKVE